MTDAERIDLETLTDEFIAEWRANPSPSRAQWDAMREKWQGRVNVEVLLRHGAELGWLGGDD